MKSAKRNNKQNTSSNSQESLGANSPSRNISWINDVATQRFQLEFCGNVEQHGLLIHAISRELKEHLGYDHTQRLLER